MTGTYASVVSSDFAFLNTALDYANAAKVDLVLTRNGVSFASVATTANQRAVANGVGGLPAGNAVYVAVAQQNAAGAQTAFDALSGEGHASAQSALINNALVVGDTINNRLLQPYGNNTLSATAGVNSYAPEDAYALSYAEKQPGAKAPWPMARKAPIVVVPPVVYASWAQGFGNWINRDSDGNAASMKSSTGGILSGFDATFAGIYRVGVAGGYSRSNIDARATSLEADSYHISAYGGARQGSFGFQAGAVYSWNDISSTRMIAFPGFQQTALGDYSAGTTQIFGEANYRFMAAATAMFEGFAGISYLNHHTRAFSETGSVAALNFAATDRDVTFSTVGLRGSALLGQSGGASFVGRGTLGWRHAFGDTDTLAMAAFTGGATPFTVAGTPITVDAVLAEAGLDVNVYSNITVGLSWTGQFGEHAQENRVKGQLVYRW